MVSMRHLVAGWLLIAATGLVCSAQIPGWTGPESAAKVINLTGQVSVLKDAEPWALHVGDAVQVRQIIISGPDGFATFQVSDGSTFEVYPNSRVTFRASPGNWRDLLDLWLGRVKVHIEKIGGKPNYNRITTPTAVISVRGTTFDVAVEEEDTTLVSVDEGQVAVQHALLPSKEPKILNTGDYVRVYKNQPLSQRGMDKTPAIQQALRAASEALYRIVLQSPTNTGSSVPSTPTTGGTGGKSGDTKAPTPPSAPSTGSGSSSGGSSGGTAPAPPPPPAP
jgi:hypothetical protein